MSKNQKPFSKCTNCNNFITKKSNFSNKNCYKCSNLNKKKSYSKNKPFFKNTNNVPETKFNSGTYGDVYAHGNTVVKKFQSDHLITFLREVFYLSCFKNVPNICDIISYDVDEMTITMPRYDGDLSQLYSKLNIVERVYFSQKLTSQMLQALEILHYHGVTHYDIKLENIFYVQNGCDYEFILGDFGISTCCNFEIFHEENVKPPENKSDYSCKIDFWMLGITIWDFILGRSQINKNNFIYSKKNNLFLPYTLRKNLKLLTSKSLENRLQFENINGINLKLFSSTNGSKMLFYLEKLINTNGAINDIFIEKLKFFFKTRYDYVKSLKYVLFDFVKIDPYVSFESLDNCLNKMVFRIYDQESYKYNMSNKNVSIRDSLFIADKIIDSVSLNQQPIIRKKLAECLFSINFQVNFTDQKRKTAFVNKMAQYLNC